MKENFPKILFFLSVMGLVFSYGFISSWKQIFPYQILREAYIAFNAVRELGEEDLEITNVEFFNEAGSNSPEYRRLGAGAGDELIFFLGNEKTYGDGSADSAYMAWIADRDGDIKHAWKDPGEIWAPLRDRDAVGSEWRSYPVGAYLYPNGDILVSYQGVNVFPISMGLAKFDKDSNLLWKNNDYYHHWFAVGPDGEIYVPDTVVGKSPLQIADRRKVITCDQGEFPYEKLAVLDSDGKEVREIDLLAALINSDLSGVLNSNTRLAEEVPTCDLLHLNGVDVLTAENVVDFPRFSAGDLVLSFRSLNGIGILDPKTEKFKWFYSGAAHHQHSPRFFADEQIMIFDNYGGAVSRGITRVLTIDTSSGEATSVFPASGSTLPERDFFSDTAGYIDVHPSRERILVSFSRQGLVWEIASKTGEVLWEFVNDHVVQGRSARVVVYTADFVTEIDFPLNAGQIE